MGKPKGKRDWVRTAFSFGEIVSNGIQEEALNSGRSSSLVIEELMQDVLAGRIDNISMNASGENRVRLDVTIDKEALDAAKDYSAKKEISLTQMLGKAYLRRYA